MPDIIQPLLQSLLEKNSLADCGLKELHEYAIAYPYFPVAQFLVAKKLQEINEPSLEKQLDKTSLYFSNPLWLNFLMNNTTGEAVIERPELDEQDFKVENTAVNQDIEVENTVVSQDNEFDNIAANQEIEVENIVANESAEIFPNDEVKHEETIVEPVYVNQEDETEPLGKEIIALEEDTNNPTDEKEVAFQIPALKIEAIDPKTATLYQPFHTVDYFASQGINFKEEDKPIDKFGQQLKSFTAWLKTMKKLPDADGQSTNTEKTDQEVAKLAEHSVADPTVETEVMAEVWVKQGNFGRAIAIYEKLSLLEPAKSVYFAAKIEALKK